MKNRVKTISISLLLLVAVLCSSLALITNGFNDWSKFSKEVSTDNVGAVIADNEKVLLENEVYELPSNLKFSTTSFQSTSTQGGVTVKASVFPVYAKNKAVDWNVSWLDADSSWAKGKKATDYVKVTPQANGSLIANIQCLKMFSEKINIVVTSRGNSDAKSICTVDYIGEIIGFNSVTVMFRKSDNEGNEIYLETFNEMVSIPILGNDMLTTFILGAETTFDFKFSDGTINPDFDKQIFLKEIRLSDGFMDYASKTPYSNGKAFAPDLAKYMNIVSVGNYGLPNKEYTLYVVFYNLFVRPYSIKYSKDFSGDSWMNECNFLEYALAYEGNQYELIYYAYDPADGAKTFTSEDFVFSVPCYLTQNERVMGV